MQRAGKMGHPKSDHDVWQAQRNGWVIIGLTGMLWFHTRFS